MKIAVSTVNVESLCLHHILLYLSGPLLKIHNILQYFYTSLLRLQLSLLRSVSLLLLYRSLFGFPMTSALSVILEEEQKGEKV